VHHSRNTVIAVPRAWRVINKALSALNPEIERFLTAEV
jgi:hypothetical protein